MKDAEHRYSDFFYPPGGILIWLIVFIEITTFSLGLIAMVYYGNLEPSVFHSSCLTLNKNIAAVNTIILLSSSYFMVTALEYFKSGNNKKAKDNIKLTILFGLIFVCLKITDYYLKTQSGDFLTTNTFYTFYWILTAFHLIHVLIGLSILLYFHITMRNGKLPELTDLSAGAVFWHMCDLIWLLLFPVLYLIY